MTVHHGIADLLAALSAPRSTPACPNATWPGAVAALDLGTDPGLAQDPMPIILPGALPTGRFAAIVANPPWPYKTYSHKGNGRSAEPYYDTMALEHIAALPVPVGRSAASGRRSMVARAWPQMTGPQVVSHLRNSHQSLVKEGSQRPPEAHDKIRAAAPSTIGKPLGSF